MPSKDRTRRPAPDQLDLTALLAADIVPVDEDAAQHLFKQTAPQVETQFRDPEDHLWAASPYGWIRRLAAAQKGKAAERLIGAWLAKHNIVPAPAEDTGHAFCLTSPTGKVRVKVRLSLRWSTGKLVFQQLTTGNYDRLILLGISPTQVYAWVVTPTDLEGRLDPSTGWLSFPCEEPPEWLSATGPELSRLAERLLA